MHPSFDYDLQEIVWYPSKEENVGANWERAAVFSCGIWNLQVQNNASGENQD